MSALSSIPSYTSSLSAPAPTHLIKHALQPLLRERRALQIPRSTNVPRHLYTRRVRDGLHTTVPELSDRFGVLAQVELGADEDDWDVGRMVRDFWPPL